MSGCFWTDLVNATQDCGGDPPDPAEQVDVMIFMSSLGDSQGLSAWQWRAGVLYSPDEPAEPADSQWVPMLGPNATLGGRGRSVVYPGGLALNMDDFYIDPGAGTLGTHGATIPTINVAGGSGSFSASGFTFDELDYDGAGIYAGLPPELRYPDFADRCLRVPARRDPGYMRFTYDVPSFSGPTLADNFRADGIGGYFFQSTYVPSSFGGSNDTSGSYYSPQLSPWGSSTINNENRLVEISWQPTATPDITIECHVTPEILVGEPGYIDAYIDNMVFHPMDNPPAPFAIPEGQGEPLDDLVLPIVWDTSWMGSAYAINGSYGEYSYENPDPPNINVGSGVVIGTLRRVNGAEICRVSILVGFGGGA